MASLTVRGEITTENLAVTLYAKDMAAGRNNGVLRIVHAHGALRNAGFLHVDLFTAFLDPDKDLFLILVQFRLGHLVHLALPLRGPGGGHRRGGLVGDDITIPTEVVPFANSPPPTDISAVPTQGGDIEVLMRLDVLLDPVVLVASMTCPFAKDSGDHGVLVGRKTCTPRHLSS